MNKLEEFEKKLGSLALEFEGLKAEAVQDEEWPKNGVRYLYIDSDGDITDFGYEDDESDKYLLAVGNVHRTKEEAEAYRDWLTSPRTQARRRVEMCDGMSAYGQFEVATSTDMATHKEVNIVTTLAGFHTGAVKFKTKEQAQACIDLLGEDVIKLALGVES